MGLSQKLGTPNWPATYYDPYSKDSQGPFFWRLLCRLGLIEGRITIDSSESRQPADRDPNLKVYEDPLGARIP